MCRPPRRRVVAATAALVAGALTLAASASQAAYFKPRKPFPDGWDSKLNFGAHATRGASRTSSVYGGAVTTYRGGQWEHHIVAKALKSASTIVAQRRDENGDALLDDAGEPLTDLITTRTNDRRFLSLQPRWFMAGDRRYLFAILDIEQNEPADIQQSRRQIAGVGYRHVVDKHNWFTAGLGVGRKVLARTTGERDIGGIGYVGLAFTRLMGQRMTFEAGLDSDFGGDNRFTELNLGLLWKVGPAVALKLGYEARANSDISDPKNPFDESVDARASISLEIDVW